MNKNIPIFIVLIIAVISLGLGIAISPYLTFKPEVPPVIQPFPPPNDDTVAVTTSPDQSSITCDWCGTECVELGSRTECPDGGMYDNKHKYWCGTVSLNGNQICQKKLRTDANKIGCDAINACAEDESCYSYSNQGFSRCVGQNENPCQFCPSGQCEVSGEAIYPPKVVCH